MNEQVYEEIPNSCLSTDWQKLAVSQLLVRQEGGRSCALLMGGDASPVIVESDLGMPTGSECDPVICSRDASQRNWSPGS